MFAIVRVLGATAFATLLAGTALAHGSKAETHLGEEGFESPPASLAQMDWLVGQWVGEGIQDAPAMESWLPPTGPTMVGTFVQETTEGAIMFTEHMYLMEEEGTVVLRLKHFNADLTGWEEKDDMLTFRLVTLEECAAYFNALTLRCAHADRPGEGLVAAVRMQSGEELVFRFKGQTRSQHSGFADDDCADLTMRGLEQCFLEKGALIEQRHAAYLESAKARHGDDPDLVEAIDKSEAAFREYRDAECSAVYESYGNGSIRVLENVLCSNKLTQRRTHTVWQHWLTFMDSSPPILPEPSTAR
ncbi:MAG: DUF6265 family protein [Erythrobacter sp.]|uniref:DUF6265 family protein n=1 Tax=Erythrobacter sp. TaxID=1042 RepID=UPI0032983888